MAWAEKDVCKWQQEKCDKTYGRHIVKRDNDTMRDRTYVIIITIDIKGSTIWASINWLVVNMKEN